jgi:hypothetical protein
MLGQKNLLQWMTPTAVSCTGPQYSREYVGEFIILVNSVKQFKMCIKYIPLVLHAWYLYGPNLFVCFKLNLNLVYM